MRSHSSALVCAEGRGVVEEGREMRETEGSESAAEVSVAMERRRERRRAFFCCRVEVWVSVG